MWSAKKLLPFMPINQSGLNEPSPSGRNKALQILAILKPLRGRGSF